MRYFLLASLLLWLNCAPSMAQVGATANAAWDFNATLPSGTLNQSAMSVVSVDSQETTCENGNGSNTLDGNTSTIWHTQYCPNSSTAPLPHQIILDIGSQKPVVGLRYLPRQDGSPNGTIRNYEVYLSTDGIMWGTPLASGALATDTTEKLIPLPGLQLTRFLKFVALTEINGNPWTSAAELNIVYNTTFVSSFQIQRCVVPACPQFCTPIDLPGATTGNTIDTYNDSATVGGKSYRHQVVAVGTINDQPGRSLPSNQTCTYVKAKHRGQPQVIAK